MQSHSGTLGGEEPISAPAVAQNGRQGLHPSRLESGQTLRTEPPNAFSMDSEPATPESQHAWETEESDEGNPFRLLAQLTGERAPDGELSLEQEADNLVHCTLSLLPLWILVLHPEFTLASWLTRGYSIPIWCRSRLHVIH